MVKIEQYTLKFLKDLSVNNNREWFYANKESYMNARRNFESFVQELIVRLSDEDKTLRGIEAGSCIFRINRDIRFSADKSPYKTNMGALIIRGGRKNIHRFAGYYIHIEPGESLTAGGAYMPPNEWLNAIREKIIENPAEFLKITGNRDFINRFGTIDGEKLKKVPRGFDPHHPQAELIKYKSYLASRAYSDKDVVLQGFFESVLSDFLAMKPLNDFLNGCN